MTPPREKLSPGWELCGNLEGRLVLFDAQFTGESSVVIVSRVVEWSNVLLEQAIEEIKQLLRIDARFRVGVMTGRVPLVKGSE